MALHDNLPDGAERAAFNADATRATFGTPVITPDGRRGFVVAVDVRDQFGLGDDVWLVQTDRGVYAQVCGDAEVRERRERDELIDRFGNDGDIYD